MHSIKVFYTYGQTNNGRTLILRMANYFVILVPTHQTHMQNLSEFLAVLSSIGSSRSNVFSTFLGTHHSFIHCNLYILML